MLFLVLDMRLHGVAFLRNTDYTNRPVAYSLRKTWKTNVFE